MAITQPVIAFQALATSTALNSSFGTFTTEINRVGGIVDAATAAATPSQLVLRDSVAGAAFGWLNATGQNTGTITFNVTGVASQTANLAQVQANGGAAGEGLLIPVSGAITTTRQITSPQFNGALNGTATTATTANGVAANAVGTAGIANGAVTAAKLAANAIASASLADRGVPFQKLQDLAPSGDGTTLVVTVQGGAFTAVVSTAIVQRVFTQNTITLIAPTTGNQWVCVYIDNTAALQLNPGTVGGTKDTAPLPSGGYAVGWAFLPQNATAVYSTQADWQTAGSSSTKGYLVPQNVNGGTAGSGGGGTSGAAVTSPFAIWGSNAGLGLSGNAEGVDTVFATAYGGSSLPTINSVNLNTVPVHPSRSRSLATDSSVDDALWEFYKQDMLSRLIFSSAVQVRMRCSSTDPVTVSIGGRRRTVAPAPGSFIQASAGGASGVKLIVLDLTTAGVGTFALVDPMPDSTGFTQAAFQKVIGQVYYDSGTSAIIGPIDPTPISNIASRAVAAEYYVATDNGTGVTITGDSNFHAVTDMTAVTFALTKPCNCFVWVTAKGQISVATVANSNVYPWLDGAQVTMIDVMIPGAASSTGNSGFVGGSSVGIVPLGIGKHTLTQGTYVQTGTSLTLGPNRQAGVIILG